MIHRGLHQVEMFEHTERESHESEKPRYTGLRSVRRKACTHARERDPRERLREREKRCRVAPYILSEVKSALRIRRRAPHTQVLEL